MAKSVWVSGYYRKDGTYVKGYYRTAPDSTKDNNYSTVGNTNPYTGEAGTKPGGANSISAGSSTNSTSTGASTGSTSGTSTVSPTFSDGGNPTPVTRSLTNGTSTTIVFWDNFLVTSRGYGSTTTKFFEAKQYSGPVNNLEKEIIGDYTAQIIYGTPANDFINGSGGDDAIDAGPGDDVLDGGTGSNFLTGGTGTDTFFIDGRNSGVTWSTVTDLEQGEWVTAWGWKEGVSKLTWEQMNGTGSYTGATARIDIDGNGSVDMSLTIAGKTSGALITVPGQVDGNGYLAFTLL